MTTLTSSAAPMTNSAATERMMFVEIGIGTNPRGVTLEASEPEKAGSDASITHFSFH